MEVKKTMDYKKLIPAILLMAVMLMPLAFADQDTTTFTWVVPANKAHTIAYGGSCSTSAFYFVESNAVIDSDIDGNADKILPYDASTAGAACQSDSVASMTITNSGNVTEDINAFFTEMDVNLQAGVFMGTGAGCGTAGLGGWESNCTVVGADSPVTQSTCRDFNASADIVSVMLIDDLPASDANQLCWFGRFKGLNDSEPAAVPQASYEETLTTETE